MILRKILLAICMISMMAAAFGQSMSNDAVAKKAQQIESKVIEWRHHLHQNPELSNREFETAKYIANHLRNLGIDVTMEVGKTGVVGLLKGGKPGPTIGLRADMDGLPVIERNDLPYKSEVRTEYLGREVGVMHACGHDTHVAMLMGAAEVLAGMKNDLSGTIKFVFQPAEEGAPPGEEGGAGLMIKEGVLKNPDVDVMFGIHINSMTPVGKARYRIGGLMAAADRFVITVNGKQTHGSTPWTGIDPIVTSAHIILGLQTIISRETELTKEAAVISVGKVTAGVRNNIIPESAELVGTIRTLDVDMQDKIHEKIKHVATTVGAAFGANVEVEISKGVPVTYNDPNLTRLMIPTIYRSLGEDNVFVSKAITGAEDFSFYANEVPSVFLFLGGMSPEKTATEVAPHHTPDFIIDDRGLVHGVRLMTNFALDYMKKHKEHQAGR